VTAALLANAATKQMPKGDHMLDGSRNFPWQSLISQYAPNLAVYNSTDEVHRKMEALANGNCSAYMTTEPAAKASQQQGAKDVKVFRLTSPHSTANKTRMLFNFGIHGREYIAAEVALRFFYTMCDGSERSMKVLNTTDFIVIPLLNVAGRKKVETAEAGVTCSSLRKNEREVDLNRNFDFHWDEGTDDSYAEDFRGAIPNSEPETKLITDLVKFFNPKVFIDIHSGDASLMYPYSFKAEACGTAQRMQALIDFVNNRDFCQQQGCVRSGPAALALNPPYVASGTSIDYMYEVLGIEYSYTWEVFSGQRANWLGSSTTASRATRNHALLQLEGGVKHGHHAHPPHMSFLASEPRDTSAIVPRHGAGHGHTKGVAQHPIVAHGGSKPLPGAMPSGLSMEECFAYFNPISADEVDHVTARWTSALLSAAEYFHTDGSSSQQQANPAQQQQQQQQQDKRQ
jgi:hypothetical protein